MYHAIETRTPIGGDSHWDPTPFDNAEANCYETEREALAMIPVLKARGGDWAEAEYRVVPITNERETIAFSFERADVALIRDALLAFRRRSHRVDRITALLAAIESEPR